MQQTMPYTYVGQLGKIDIHNCSVDLSVFCYYYRGISHQENLKVYLVGSKFDKSLAYVFIFQVELRTEGNTSNIVISKFGKKSL